MVDRQDNPIKRSERFLLHHQIVAISDSLRLLIQTNQKPGVRTYQLLKKLLDDTLELTRGRCVTPAPQLDESDIPADWLVTAENLRALSTAFLTPEEQEESRKFGFSR